MELEEQQSSANANIDTLQRYFAALNRWDFETAERLLTQDVVFEMPYAPAPVPKVIEGHDTVVGFLKSLQEAVDEPRLQDIRIEAFASDPRELVAEFRSEMGIRATGGAYTNTYIARATIRDGQIARYVEFFDPTRISEMQVSG